MFQTKMNLDTIVKILDTCIKENLSLSFVSEEEEAQYCLKLRFTENAALSQNSFIVGKISEVDHLCLKTKMMYKLLYI